MITDREAEAQRAGGTRIATGIWVDASGHIHFSIPELLAMVDLPNTPENRDRVVEMAAAIVQEHGGKVIRQELES